MFHTGITAVRVLTTIATKRWTAVVGEALLLSVVECEATAIAGNEHVLAARRQGPSTCRKALLIVGVVGVAQLKNQRARGK